MILTVTLNPALDRTVALSGPLERGRVQRVRDVRQQAGGKGVNVTRALLASGVESLAIVPAADGDPFLSAARTLGLPVRAVPVSGPVRTNIALTEPDGTTTKLNEPGPRLSAQELRALQEAILDEVRSRGVRELVFAGSLPAGTADAEYARLVRALRTTLGDACPRIVVDGSGAPMRSLIASGERVDLIKPNAEELAELTGGDGEAMEAEPRIALAAARRLLETSGVREALVTLGAGGALLVDARRALFARPPRIRPVSTVGAGDASLAGLLLARSLGRSDEQALAQATAHGAAAACLPGSTMPTSEQTDPGAVEVRSLESPGRTPHAEEAHGRNTEEKSQR